MNNTEALVPATPPLELLKIDTVTADELVLAPAPTLPPRTGWGKAVSYWKARQDNAEALAIAKVRAAAGSAVVIKRGAEEKAFTAAEIDPRASLGRQAFKDVDAKLRKVPARRAAAQYRNKKILGGN